MSRLSVHLSRILSCMPQKALCVHQQIVAITCRFSFRWNGVGENMPSTGIVFIRRFCSAPDNVKNKQKIHCVQPLLITTTRELFLSRFRPLTTANILTLNEQHIKKHKIKRAVQYHKINNIYYLQIMLEIIKRNIMRINRVYSMSQKVQEEKKRRRIEYNSEKIQILISLQNSFFFIIVDKIKFFLLQIKSDLRSSIKGNLYCNAIADRFIK